MRDKIKLLFPSSPLLLGLSLERKRPIQHFLGRDDDTLFVRGRAHDSEIKFKLLIVFNTLLCPAKHLNYLLSAFTSVSSVGGCEFLCRYSYFPRGQNVALLDIDLNGHFHFIPKRTLSIHVEQIFHSINNDLYVECK